MQIDFESPKEKSNLSVTEKRAHKLVRSDRPTPLTKTLSNVFSVSACASFVGGFLSMLNPQTFGETVYYGVATAFSIAGILGLENRDMFYKNFVRDYDACLEVERKYQDIQEDEIFRMGGKNELAEPATRYKSILKGDKVVVNSRPKLN